MRVNDGQVRFYEEDDDPEDIPNKTWDMEDLFREALEQDTYYDEEKDKLSKKNRSPKWIYDRVNQVFLKGLKNRISAADYADAENFELNPFDDYEEELEKRNEFINELTLSKSEWFKSVMTSISLIPNKDWKIALIVYMGLHGPLIKNGSAFRLLTEFNNEAIADLSKEELKEIIDANIEINKFIELAQSDVKQRKTNIINDFIESSRNFAEKGYEDELENNLRDNLETLMEDSTSNIKRMIFGNEQESYHGWRIDNDFENDLLMNKKKFNEFSALLVDFRKNMTQIDFIPQNVILKHFGWYNKKYQASIVPAYGWLVESFRK